LENLVKSLRIQLDEAISRKAKIKAFLRPPPRPTSSPILNFVSRASSVSSRISSSSDPCRNLSLGIISQANEVFLKSSMLGDSKTLTNVSHSRRASVRVMKLGKKSRRRKSDAGEKSEEKRCDDASLKANIADIRLKIREIKVAEERRIREVKFDAKQLLTHFSSSGMKIQTMRDSPSSKNIDPMKELVSLIEVMDSTLSTNEALSILKELGVDYQPRSAMGKKNAMATDLSAALASNGLRLTNLRVADETEN